MKLTHPELFNIEHATKVHDFVTANPDRHRQHLLIQGTQGCIAGWTVALSDRYGSSAIARMETASIRGMVEWMDAAQDLLGLTDREAYRLFSPLLSASNARKRLGRMIEQAQQYQTLQADFADTVVEELRQLLASKIDERV